MDFIANTFIGNAFSLPNTFFINFKDFDSIEDALKQYKKEWNDDFEGRKGSSKGNTRKEAIQILKDGGYATNPNYVDTIETIANEYSDLY